jgi:uncharacterized membrane protein (DUF485 family)
MQVPNIFTYLEQAIVYWQIHWFNMAALIVAWAALVLGGGILIRSIRQRVKRAGVPANAVNGVILAMRLVMLFIGFLIFLAFFPDWAALMAPALGGSSLLVGTAVGLAVGTAVRNFVSGLYVMLTRPFRVGEYVSVGDSEGIVEEISINYTRILQSSRAVALVPNSRVVDSTVTNFTIEKKELLTEQVEEGNSLRHRVIGTISRALEAEKLVRYSFSMSFPITHGPKTLARAFDGVCKRWAKDFGFPPIYDINAVSHLAVTYMFTIFVGDPWKILDHKGDFIKDILQTVYHKTHPKPAPTQKSRAN